ncbi:hypothetical protein [Tissierella sp.]|uniref:hypothetical protein n=1 Tax=Tissierella sp. TaxID=41274 RepID=UPI0028A92542|nr:hypothetical protein [Tissierella sp.]
MGKRSIRKVALILLTLMMIFGTASAYTAAEETSLNQAKVYIDENGMMDFSGLEVELIESEGGIYKAEILIEDKNATMASGPSAVMTWSLSRDANYDNLYDIYYNITANTLINGVVGDLKITNTSVLYPETYFEIDGYAKSFPATTFYAGNAGKMVGPRGEKIKLSFTNTKMFFLSSGWLS